MNINQDKQLKALLRETHFVAVAQIANAIDQVLGGTLSTEGLKILKVWQSLTTDEKTALSALVNDWLCKQGGGVGVLSKVNVVYRDHPRGRSVIMPSKLML